jgi:KDO2-lipid IV(A) lauroyltransferase
LSDHELSKLVTSSLQQTTKTGLEMGKCWLWPMEKTLSMITEVSGEPAFEEARAHGKGVILVTPHLGNWEIFANYLAFKAPTTFLYQPQRNRYFDKLMKTARIRGKLKIEPTNYRGVAQLLKMLKKGETVGILPDQEPATESGIFAPFFGVPALTMTLVSGLVERTGARVICGFAQRLPNAEGFRLHVYPADPMIYDKEQQNSVEGLNRSVEHCVRQAIDQYQWEYKRFKRRPDGSRFYKR